MENCPLCGRKLIQRPNNLLVCPFHNINFKGENYQSTPIQSRMAAPTRESNLEKSVLRVGELLGLQKEDLASLKRFLYLKGSDYGKEFLDFIQTDDKARMALIRELRDWQEGKPEVFLLRRG